MDNLTLPLNISKEWNDIKDTIDLERLASDIKEQTFFANVLDWLRDYYQIGKVYLYDLAVYCVGCYYVEKDRVAELNKTK